MLGNAIGGIRDSVLTARRELREAGSGWILVVVATGWSLVLGTRFVFPALLPQIRPTFGLSNTAAGATISAIWVAYAAVQFPSGLLTDRLGEQLVLTGSTLAAVGAVTVVVLSPSFAPFFFGAVLFGLGTGLYATPRITVLSNTYANRNSTAIALTFAAGSLGSAALPFIAGRLAESVDWRLGFAVVILPFAIVTIGLWRILPRDSTDATRAADGSIRHIIKRLITALSDRAVLLAWLGLTLSLFVFQGVSTFLTTYLVSVKDFSTGLASGMFAIFFAVGAISQPLSGSLADRFSQRAIMIGLGVFGALPLLLLPFATGTVVLAGLSVALGVRLGIGPLNNAYIADALPEDVQGAGFGFVRMFHISLGSTGSLIVGFMADNGLFNEAFFLLSALSAVGAVIYFLLPVDR